MSDERELILHLLDGQRIGIRNAVSGLTDEQARSAPSASEMSLASLLKHVIDGEETMTDRVAGTEDRGDDPVAAWLAGWRVGPDETVDHLLQRWERVAARTEQVVRAEGDLGRAVPLAPDVAKWLRPPASGGITVRFLLLHSVEELARHAGHADVIRESIDGATAGTLSQS